MKDFIKKILRHSYNNLYRSTYIITKSESELAYKGLIDAISRQLFHSMAEKMRKEKPQAFEVSTDHPALVGYPDEKMCQVRLYIFTEDEFAEILAKIQEEA